MNFISPFLLYAKTLCSAPKFYAPKKLLRSWAQSVKWLCTKLMRWEVPNRIVVIESKCLSEFDRWLWSDSDYNEKSESTISIFDIIRSYSIYFQLKSILFLIKIDLFWNNVDYSIKNDDIYWKNDGFNINSPIIN